MRDSDNKTDKSLVSWLGFNNPPEFLKAPRFGIFVGWITVLIFSTLVVLLLADLLMALATNTSESVRNYGLLFAALISAPFLIWRTHTLHRQANTAEQGLITDRISKAVEQIGAERTVKKDGEESTQPNIEVRIGGLFSLERIAQQNLEEHIQIMEILCAYVRENLNRKQGVNDPPIGSNKHLPDDISTVFKIFSRRSNLQKDKESQWASRDGQSYKFHFKDCNFRGYRFWGLNFDNCIFSFCDFSNAVFFRSKIVDSDFSFIHLEGTTFNNVEVKNTLFNIPQSVVDLNVDQCNFVGCEFYKFDFEVPIISDDTKFKGSLFLSCSNVVKSLNKGQKETALGIGKFNPNDGCIPEHWTTVEATNKKVDTYWRAWQKTKGSQPK